MRICNLVVFAALFLSLPCRADEPQIEVKLVPDKPTIMLGEPTSLAYVVQNLSDEDLQVIVGGDYRNALGRPESFKVKVLKEDGQDVPQPRAGVGFGGMFGPQQLPAHGNFTFKLFLPHWATFAEAGTYSIVAKRTLSIGKSGSTDWLDPAKTTKVPSEASTSITVVPQDEEKMGEVIAQLGDLMLRRGDTRSGGASRSLAYIPDERVIPYFVKAVDTADYSLEFTALNALAPFNSEAAFLALTKGMESKDDNIRHTSAAALSRSPYPRAIPFLLSKRGDKSNGVQITIIQALGKMAPEKAIPLLKEMAQSKDKMVSDEASRHLKLLMAK